ncbi:unnamed protein product [Sympodiomycopsis kandeliae]
MTISSLARGAGTMRLHLQAQRSLAPASSYASASASSSMSHSLKRQITRPRITPSYSPITVTSSLCNRNFSSTLQRGFQPSRSSAALFGSLWGGEQQPTSVSDASATQSSQSANPLDNVSASPSAGTSSIEHVSTSAAGQDTPIIDEIVSLDPTTSANALETVVTATHTFSEIPHSWWPNVRVLEYLLQTTADVTHLPWWAVIVGVTLTARLALLPLAISGHARSIRMANIQPQMKNVMESMKAAKANGDQLLASETTMKVAKMFQQHDCHPGKMIILPLVQGTFFGSFFFCIRRLAENGLVGLNESVGYLPSLMLPDSTWILPVTAAATSLIVFETGAEMGAATSANNQTKVMRYVFRGLLPLMVFWTYSLPSAIFFFWLTNNAYSLVQMVALSRPSVQRALGFPARIKHPKTEEPPKKGGDGGFKGFMNNIRQGYEAERKRVMANAGDNYSSSSPRPAQSLNTERHKAYQKWLKPAQAAVSSSAPNSDLFESETGKTGGERENVAPKANNQDAAKHARIQASRQRRAQRKRH